MIQILGRLSLPHLARWLTFAILLPLLSTHAAAQTSVSGSGFTIQDLRTGGTAYRNRKYTWLDIPTSMRGWKYTQTAGGAPALISVKVARDSWVYIATGPDPVNFPGWKPVPSLSFSYSDSKQTRLNILARLCQAGMPIEVPQVNWSGTLVLAPDLVVEGAPVPGVVIDYSPPESRSYIGSPSIAVLPNGEYIASHDLFGPGTTNDQTRVFRSRDRGKTWELLADIRGQWWSTLFLHETSLYLMGVSRESGSAVIRRSTDGGRTWSTPSASSSGLLAAGHYSCAPTPVISYNGRLWRAMEQQDPAVGGRHFLPFMMSAPVDVDLLQAKNWTFSNRVPFGDGWPGTNWLEGNAVVAPGGQVVIIIRVAPAYSEKASIIQISPDGSQAAFDPASGFINFPGGGTKFTIRYDPAAQKYWSLVNKQHKPDAERNILALTSSTDLFHWTVESIILQDPHPQDVAFEYLDWLFEGNDIIAVSRTAYNGSHTFHDADYLTFHRLLNFRSPQRSLAP